MTTHRLLDLQEVDSAIDRHRARQLALGSGEGTRAARGEADAAEARLGELRLQIDVMDRDAARLEHEIDSMSQKRTVEERRLYDGSVANAKELESLRHEVDNLKRRTTDREDELLALMEQRETLERAAKEAEAGATDLRANVDLVSSDDARELERIGADLAERLAEREAIVAELDPELFELYEDLRPLKKGIAAAALVDGVCQGCHEQLSAVELDHVKRAEGVKRCEHCRRILVL